MKAVKSSEAGNKVQLGDSFLKLRFYVCQHFCISVLFYGKSVHFFYESNGKYKFYNNDLKKKQFEKN